MILIAGATGITGRQIAARLHAQGLPIALAARKLGRLQEVAATLGLPATSIRAIDFTSVTNVGRALQGVTVVVNVISPAAAGSAILAEAVVQRGLAYTDISGDLRSTRTLLDHWHTPAQTAGAVLAPGAGFAPYCGITLLLLARERLPDATQLRIVYASPGFKPSKGTLASEPETLAGPCLELRDGHLVESARFGKVVRSGDGHALIRPMLDPLLASTIPGVRDCSVEMQMRFIEAQVIGGISRLARPLLRKAAVRSFLERRIAKMSEPPADHADGDQHNVVSAIASNGRQTITVRCAAPSVYGGTAAACAAVAAQLYRRAPELRGFVPPPLLFASPADAARAVDLRIIDERSS